MRVGKVNGYDPSTRSINTQGHSERSRTMTYTATVTSQGQITIPVEIRRKLKLDKNRKIILKFENNAIFMESEPDIMQLSGSLSSRAIKNKSIDETIRLEEDAVGEAVVEQYRKKMKKMGIAVPK